MSATRTAGTTVAASSLTSASSTASTYIVMVDLSRQLRRRRDLEERGGGARGKQTLADQQAAILQLVFSRLSEASLGIGTFGAELFCCFRFFPGARISTVYSGL